MVLLLYAEGIEGVPYAEKRPQYRREEAPVPRGGPLCRKVFCAERIGGGPCVGRRPLCREDWRRPLCREEAPVLRGLEETPVPRGGHLCRRFPVLKGFKEAPVSGGDSLCRMVLLLYAEGIEGGPYAEKRPQYRREEAPVPRGGPLCRKVFCAERIGGLAPVSGGGPCVGRRPLCREEVLCAGRSCPLLRGLKEAPVSGGGSLCRMVLLLYAEGIEGGPFADKRLFCRREEAPYRREEAHVPPRGGPCAAERRPLCREETLCAGRSSVLRGLEEAPVS